jgi:SAM-dependent methyltransferase
MAASHGLTAEEAAVFETTVVPRYLSLYGKRLLSLVASANDARVFHLDCRTGYPDAALIERLPNAHVYASDRSEPAVELARTKATAITQANPGVAFEYRVADALPLSFPPGAFSHAFSLHPLAPPSERSAILAELARILAPHGQVLLALPLRGSFGEVFDLLREYAVKYEASDILNAVDTAGLQRPAEDTLVGELEDAGFEYVEVDAVRRTLPFESGRAFLDDPVTRLVLLPELRLGLPLPAQQALDPFVYVRDAIDKYWSDGTFELTLEVGVASGRRKG